MSPRRIRAASLMRLLGAWRGDQVGPAYRQLADGLRLLILDGRLPLDVVLPGERELAHALEVSRTTVTGAFTRLREQGFLQSRQGAGARTRLPTGPGHRDSGPLIRPSEPGVLDLTAAALPAGDFVHQAYAKAIEALPAHLPHHGYEPVGLPVLREAIAARYSRRGLPTRPDQVLVTHGAQHAWALMLRLLAGPGDRVVIDHPTYPNAIDAILRSSCRPVPVSLPQDGWDAEGVVAAFQQSAPRLAHLVPDFHNPTGRWMDFAGREAIAAAGVRTRTVVVFDETMLDLSLDEPRASYGFDEPPGAIVRLGSTGKSFWGGLRIGWIRAEPEMIAALGRMRASIDLGTPVLEQLAAAALLQDDEAALAARRAELRERRDLLVALAAERLPDWRVSPPPGGLSVWAELPAPVSNALAATCERDGVRIAAGPRFGVDGAFERFVRLPFTLPAEPMTEAIDRLAAAYGRLRPQAANTSETATRAVV
ncbi:PLP-dependent aminotransferase family protein [Phenylobacterium sp. VNQ135]|uniref:MocR-like transcription factor YczR n=1 Tax=Phenylobacterium sp. VNQ135 TaxID=3400922 RepID=UPI003C11A1EB